MTQTIRAPAMPIVGEDASETGKEPAKTRLARMVQADYRLIWRLLRRLGVSAEATDDATQQVFLIAAERLDDIHDSSERAFLFGTALRVARSTHRRTGREPPTDAGDRRPSMLPPPDELTEQKRAREMLNRVLDILPLDVRTVFILFELEGLSSPEIAELLGVPVGTVASRLRRGRMQFHEGVRTEMAKLRSRETSDEGSS